MKKSWLVSGLGKRRLLRLDLREEGEGGEEKAEEMNEVQVARITSNRD
jgi:hypothetical protein